MKPSTNRQRIRSTRNICTAILVLSLFFNQLHAQNNTFYGAQAGLSNTIGERNSFYGYRAGWSNTAGSYNSFFGHLAGQGNTYGDYNTCLGHQAGFHNTAGSYNTFLGLNAGFNNSTGHHNTYTGTATGLNNTSGYYNTFTGHYAGWNNTMGYQNTFTGHQAGYRNITGNYNTFIGTEAGLNHTTGSYNISIGYRSGYLFAAPNDPYYSLNLNNTIVIGFQAMATADNQVRIGNWTTSSIGGFANWTNISDKRIKKDVNEGVAGLEFIMKLHPVTYHLDADAIAGYFNIPDSMRSKEAESAKVNILQSGFIAQEVEQAAMETGYEFSGVDAPKNEHDLYGLRYAEFVVPLVKGMQEQQVLISEQQQVIAAQTARLEKLQSEINAIKESLSGTGDSGKNTSAPTYSGEQDSDIVNDMQLFQNVPNPFKETTTISYQLNAAGVVSLQIYSENGLPVKTLFNDYQEKGAYKIEWNAANHPQGKYIYVLLQNDIELARKMILVD